MERAMLQEISATIAAVGRKGEFAVEERGSADDLALRIRGVGRVHSPITESTAKKLIAAASPSPFGVRDETRYDQRVRSTWEIPADRITIDGGFGRALAPKLDAIRRRLGLPRDGALRPVLDKLLVYGPGQFFASHQDSERSDDMVATLVVVLPSRHTGGAIVVTHNGRRRVFAADGGGDLGLVAFYTDCRHEVERVKAGHRTALTFHLFHVGAPAARASRGRSGAVDRLIDTVDAYFSTRVPPRYGAGEGELPDRLVYLLDHEYTQRGLSFKRLKGKDRLRVSALLKVAERLDCEAYLALAEIHETWNCEGDDDDASYWRSGSRHRALDGNDPDDYQILDLCDSEVELRHWVGPDGAMDPGVPANVGDDEICSTRPSVEMVPFRSEHEGYMGNYGNTVDRWYHRAALVLWPRSRAYVVRAKASPTWAIDELDRLDRAGKKEEARSKARSLLPFWRHRAAAVQARSFAKRVAGIAAALDDPDLARALVEPLGPGWLNATTAPALLTAAERFGLTWSQQLFAAWGGSRLSESSVLAVLPVLTRALSAHRWPDARALGAFLLEREGAAFRARCIESRSLLPTRSGKEAGAVLARDAVTLIESAAALDQTEAREQIFAILTGAEAALPPVLIADVLQRCRAKRTPGDVRRLGLGPLHEHVVRSLSVSLARPPRAPDNWSLARPIDCTCALCERLATFLQDPQARELPWPLAKERRQHIHSVIDRFDLPVAHDTIRKGSPFTLMLEKQAILFTREAAEREHQAKLLHALERSHAAFAN